MDAVRRTIYISSGIAICGMTGIIVANVIGRIFFNTPISGTMEFTGFGGVIFVSAAMGFVEWGGRNVIVEVVFRRLPRRFQDVVEKVGLFLSLLTGAFYLMAAAGCAWDSLYQQEIAIISGVLKFPFRVIWLAGLLFLTVVLFDRVSRSWRRSKG